MTQLLKEQRVHLSNFQRFFGLEWGQFSAAAALFVAPLLAFTWFVQPHLVRGMSVKGRA